MWSTFAVVIWASMSVVELLAAAPAQLQDSTRIEWREAASAAGAVQRYACARATAQPADGGASALVVAVTGPRDAAGVELALQRVREHGRFAPETHFVACDADATALADVVQHARQALVVAQRAHLVGEELGATRALELAVDRPELVASVCAFAPTPLGPERLARAAVLAEVPLALLRGRADAREPLLELVELAIGAGGESQALDFVSTREHARVAECEGRFAEHARRFTMRERARAGAEHEVRALLDRFHGAASRADGSAYFACLSADAVFIGTDASERWDVRGFRDYCEPYFRQGRGWTYVASERNVASSRGLDVAWFDERLAHERYGEVRGSGVARREGAAWRIVHYVMSFPVPNELSAELVQRVKGLKR
jgi:pimeloyl-ACP methyl ester carboxylesterase